MQYIAISVIMKKRINKITKRENTAWRLSCTAQNCTIVALDLGGRNGTVLHPHRSHATHSDNNIWTIQWLKSSHTSAEIITPSSSFHWRMKKNTPIYGWSLFYCQLHPPILVIFACLISLLKNHVSKSDVYFFLLEAREELWENTYSISSTILTTDDIYLPSLDNCNTWCLDECFSRRQSLHSILQQRKTNLIPSK